MCEHSSGYRIKCPNCRTYFFICVSCFRGHRYCPSDCSSIARRCSKNRASKRYRDTALGKKNHRAAQDRHRKKKKVIHHPSPPLPKSIKEKPGVFSKSPNRLNLVCVACGSILIRIMTARWRGRKKGGKNGFKPRSKGRDEENVLR